MFLSSKMYLDQFRGLIEKNQCLSIAVAFWGEGAQRLIAEAWSGRSLQIICNLGSGGTNPQVIRDLLGLAKDTPGIQILTLDNLHAKVAIGEAAAIVGSANLPVNGLGFEGAECVGWHEAGVLVNEIAQLTQMREWFDGMWAQGAEITDDRLNKAQLQWDRNRTNRPLTTERLLDAPNDDLRNRNIHIAIYKLEASVQAKAEAAQAEKDARCSDFPAVRNTKLEFFEDWPDDSEEPLPADAPIIVVRYGPTRQLTNVSAWVRIPQLDRTFMKPGQRDPVSLIMLGQLKYVAGMALSKEDGRGLAKRLKPWVDKLYVGAEEGTARCVPLDDFIEWEAKRSVLTEARISAKKRTCCHDIKALSIIFRSTV